jgi:hypothetical protein
MEIGKPRRVHRVEPLKQPVPSKRRQEEAPRRTMREDPTPIRTK